MDPKNGKRDTEYGIRANLLAFALFLTSGFWLLPSAFGQAITVNTPIHTNNQFDRAEPMQEWECSTPQLNLGTNELLFLDVNGSVGDYVDCHGRIHGGGSGGTVTSVDLIQGANILLTGTCDSTTAISCTIAATAVPITLETNGSDNSLQNLLNFINSTANAAALSVTASNPAGGEEKFEITASAAAGGVYGNDTAAPAEPAFYVPETCGDATHAVSFNVDVPDWFGCQTITGSGTTPGAPVYAIQVNQPLNTFAGYSDFTWEDSNQNLLIGSGSVNGNANEVAIGHQNNITGNGDDFAFGTSNTVGSGVCMAIGFGVVGCAQGNTIAAGVFIGISETGTDGANFSAWANTSGEGQATVSSFYHSFSNTLYNLTCMYADQEIFDCGPNASNWVGVTNNPSGEFATDGVTPVSSTNSAVVGDWVCTNSSGSQVTDSGSTVGCGADTYPVGVVTNILQFGATTPVIKIARGNGAGGGGGTPGGSPTQIQYNLGGSFAGIAGSAVDTSGDVTIAPTVPTTSALSVIAANDQSALVATSTGDGVHLSIIEAFSTNTDNSGGGTTTGMGVDAILLGSNTTGDNYTQIDLGRRQRRMERGQPDRIDVSSASTQCKSHRLPGPNVNRDTHRRSGFWWSTGLNHQRRDPDRCTNAWGKCLLDLHGRGSIAARRHLFSRHAHPQ